MLPLLLLLAVSVMAIAQDSTVTVIKVDAGSAAELPYDPSRTPSYGYVGGSTQGNPGQPAVNCPETDGTVRYTPIINGVSIPFSYIFPLENDVLYRIKLTFCEPSQNGPGLRLFNVKINDQMVLQNFDIFKSAGGAQKKISRTFMVIASESQIRIDFQTVSRSALIAAIEITSEIIVRNATLGVFDSNGSKCTVQVLGTPHLYIRCTDPQGTVTQEETTPLILSLNTVWKFKAVTLDSPQFKSARLWGDGWVFRFGYLNEKGWR